MIPKIARHKTLNIYIKDLINLGHDVGCHANHFRKARQKVLDNCIIPILAVNYKVLRITLFQARCPRYIGHMELLRIEITIKTQEVVFSNFVNYQCIDFDGTKANQWRPLLPQIDANTIAFKLHFKGSRRKR